MDKLVKTTYFVFHHINPDWKDIPEGTEVDNTDYELVALIDGDDIEEAFRATNHVVGPWQENESVLFGRPHARSTSVGDIVLDSSNQKAYAVAGMGFTEVKFQPTLSANPAWKEA